MTVIDNPAQNRFELPAGDHMAVAYYTLSPGVITFTHTEVPQELSGHGIGSTRRQRQEELADVWSFLLWQFGS